MPAWRVLRAICGGDGGLAAAVVGGAVGGGGDGSVVGVGVVVGLVVVEEGRDLQDGGGVEGVQPGRRRRRRRSRAGTSRRPLESYCWLLDAVGVGVVGNLEEVVAELGDEAELVLRGAVVDEGGEAAVAVGGIVDDLADGRGEAVVAAVAVEAGVVGELFGVVAEVELVVGLEEVAGGEDEFGLAVALEAGAGDDVEDAVGAVADVGGVAAALDLEVVDVLGVDLRGEVAGDVGVGDLDAVDQPGDLVAAAHVQHVVGHVGAGDVVGDHGHAVGAVGAGGLGDVFAVDESGGGDGVDVGGVRSVVTVTVCCDGAELAARSAGWVTVSEARVRVCCAGVEAGLGDGDGVVAEREGGDGERAVLRGDGGLGEGGVGGAEFDVCAGDGAVLGVVDDAVELAEDGGSSCDGAEE